MSTVVFTPDRLERFETTLRKYETKASALLPTLYLAQEQFGYLTNPVMDYVASLLEMAPVQVYEAASFYLLFKKKEMGRFCLQVCNNITCTMMGSEELLKIIQEELGIGPSEVTDDKMFSLLPVQCLGSCDTAPVVQVNEDYVEKLNPEKFREFLRKLKRGEKPQELQATL